MVSILSPGNPVASANIGKHIRDNCQGHQKVLRKQVFDYVNENIKRAI